MTGVCLFVCVVGPGFDSTSPAFVRSRASQAEGSNGRIAQKTESDPHGVLVCHDQVRLQVSQGFRCRDSYTHELIPPDSAIDPLVTSQSDVWCKQTDVSHLVVKSVQMSIGSPNTLCL